jgi:hypothetical protein
MKKDVNDGKRHDSGLKVSIFQLSNIPLFRRADFVKLCSGCFERR